MHASPSQSGQLDGSPPGQDQLEHFVQQEPEENDTDYDDESVDLDSLGLGVEEEAPLPEDLPVSSSAPRIRKVC